MKLSHSEQLSFTTVRIECELESGKESVGTGFFFSFDRREDVYVPAIITNKHVVKGAKRGAFHVTLKDDNGEPQVGNVERIILEDFEKCWVPHPDNDVDLCAMPLAPLLEKADEVGKKPFLVAFETWMIPDGKLLDQLAPLEELVMVGYPIGLWDETNNMPIMRRGTAATHPNLDYNGTREFLIDMACFPGSSGSPVLLWNYGIFSGKSGPMMGNRIQLLGILYAIPVHTIEGEMTVAPVPTQMQPTPVSDIPTNLGFVIKAERLLDFSAVLA